MATSKANNVLANLIGAEGEGMQYYSPHMVRALGISIAESVFLFYVARWSRSAWDGWCFRTEEQIEYDTAIPSRTLRRIRDRLRDMGLLEEERRGMPARMYYRINAALLLRTLGDAPPASPPVVDEDHVSQAKWPDKLGQNGRTSPDKMAGLYKENTKENTFTPPTPPGGIPPQNAKTTDVKGTRLDESWSPTEDDRRYASGKGFSDSEIDLIAERFRNHWVSVPGQRGLKIKWDATWRNWVLEEVRRGTHGGNGRAKENPMRQGLRDVTTDPEYRALVKSKFKVV